MVSTVGIASVFFVLIAASGIGLTLLIDPSGPILRTSTLPVGLATLVVLSYPFGLLFDYSAASPAILGLVVLLLAVGLVSHWRNRTRGVTVARIEPGALIATAGAALVGLTLLLPLLKAGFPSTLGITNNDGWGYAGLIDWLAENRYYFPPEDPADPLSFIAAGQNAFNFSTGFERTGAVLTWLLGEAGYRVVGPMLAVIGAVAVPSFGMLARAMGAHRGTAIASTGVVFALTPLLVLAYADVYASQFITLALAPFVLASFIGATQLGGWQQAGLAALALTAAVSIFPTSLIWTLPTIGVVVGWHLLKRARPDTDGRSVTALLMWPGLAIAGSLALGFIQWDSAWRNLIDISGKIGNPGFPSSSAEKATILALGASAGNDGLAGAALTWTLLTMSAIAAAAIGVIAVRACMSRPRGLGLLAASATTVLIITIALVFNYRVIDPYPYGAFKALIGGMPFFFAILLVGGLITMDARRGDGLTAGAIAVLGAMWIPVSMGLLSAQADGTTGFRAMDVEMSRAVEGLPPKGFVLLAGTKGEYARRLAAINLISQKRPEASEGFGTAPSALAKGGAEDRWLPKTPWQYSIETEALPLGNQGPIIWSNGSFALRQTPAVSLTTWGTNWSTVEPDGCAWTSGPVSIVIGSRLPKAQPGQLSLVAESAGYPRTLHMVGPNNRVLKTAVIRPATRTPVTSPIAVAPGVLKVDLDPTPSTPVHVGNDPRELVMRVCGIRIETRKA